MSEKPVKRGEHPLTSALVLTLSSGTTHIPKIAVRLSGDVLRTRRPKWIARWGAWCVYDSGWMALSEDRSVGGCWQTEEVARHRAEAKAREDARWDAAIANYRSDFSPSLESPQP